MRNEVLKFALDMDLVLDRHQKGKGDSWKTCHVKFLEDKLKEEFKEWKNTKDSGELIDIANICMMLYQRDLGIKEYYEYQINSSKCRGK